MAEKSLEVLKLQHKRKLQYSLQIMAAIFIISIAIAEADFGDSFGLVVAKTGLMLVLAAIGISSVKATRADLREIEEKVNNKQIS